VASRPAPSTRPRGRRAGHRSSSPSSLRRPFPSRPPPSSGG
jgi:hypothetical protein